MAETPPPIQPANPHPPAPARSPESESPPPPPESSSAVFPAIMAFLMGGLLVGAGLYTKYGFPPADAEAQAETAPAPAPTDSEPTPTVASAEQLQALQTRVEELASHLEDVSKAASAPRPEEPQAPADLSDTLQKLDQRLGDEDQRLGDLDQRLGDLDQRLGDTSNTLKSVQDEQSSLQKRMDQVEKSATEAKAESSQPPQEDVNLADQAVSEGDRLFRQSQYQEALDRFTKAEESAPNDARVWYYAALANGFATGNWQGETERLVRKGLEREQAGTPATDKIDALFQGLTRNQGKDWLAGWRQRAKR